MMEKILEMYQEIKSVIERRLKEFKELYEKEDDPRIFAEMAFCLLTPQSKAKICWKAIEELMENDLLYTGSALEIFHHLKGVRFSEKKALYIVKAREMFFDGKEWKLKEFIDSFDDVFKLREWLVGNIKGYGYKEASHFLRNIGKGENLAILDRHILKNLALLGVIPEIPKSLTRSRYLYIEERMRDFSKKIGIPMDHLDLLLWYKEAGEVFK
jgi:N-glycosylase/DNA lyase